MRDLHIREEWERIRRWTENLFRNDWNLQIITSLVPHREQELSQVRTVCISIPLKYKATFGGNFFYKIKQVFLTLRHIMTRERITTAQNRTLVNVLTSRSSSPTWWSNMEIIIINDINLHDVEILQFNKILGTSKNPILSYRLILGHIYLYPKGDKPPKAISPPCLSLP